MKFQRKHQTAVFTLIITLIFYNISLTTFDQLMEIQLLGDIIHVFLLPILLFGITLMRNVKYSFIITIIIIITYFLIEFMKQKAEFRSIAPDSYTFILYVTDVIAIFFTAGFCIHHFKLLSLDYSINIINQKIQIENQHKHLKAAHFEMQDSIEYAKRIQSAILPSDKLVKEYFKESFIFYKPKDIVAGDFYWTQQTKNHILFAVADCTGHGVPGAMVSVVCNNALNRSVREFNLTIPGEILDKTREIVIKEFEKSDENVLDGMDIALVKIPLIQTENHFEIEFAGANCPLWIIRNNELLEYKSCKQPIGKYVNPTDFVTKKINIFPNDNLYIFSDGYPDQFGRERGKKFKYEPFRQLFKSICNLSMNEQRQAIKNNFIDWKGYHEQVDDICVIGVKI